MPETISCHQSLPQYVTAIVVGAGPIGLLTASQLNGVEYIHDQAACSEEQLHRSVKNNQLVYRTDLPEKFNDRRGRTPSGQWFDSFQYNTDELSATCLNKRIDNSRKVDWLLLSESSAGGGWTNYHDEQLTISPAHWMSMPSEPMEQSMYLHDSKLAQERIKTNAKFMCRYLESYAEQLPQERLFFNHKVISACKKGKNWQLQVSSSKGSYNITCKYLVLAIGKGKKNMLGIPGENNINVAHSTNEILKEMKKVTKPSSLLVIGTGLSAADTITHAWKRGITVTHSVPEELIESREGYDSKSSSKLLMSLLNKEHEFPLHCRVIKAMLNPELHTENYRQLKDYRLINIDEKNICTLKNLKNDRIIKSEFTHIAILTGTLADFSFLTLKNKIISERPMHDVDKNTLEISEQENIFLAGSCTGDVFQRFVLGHATSVAETIKAREEKLMA